MDTEARFFLPRPAPGYRHESQAKEPALLLADVAEGRAKQVSLET